MRRVPVQELVRQQAKRAPRCSPGIRLQRKPFGENPPDQRIELRTLIAPCHIGRIGRRHHGAFAQIAHELAVVFECHYEHDGFIRSRTGANHSQYLQGAAIVTALQVSCEPGQLDLRQLRRKVVVSRAGVGLPVARLENEINESVDENQRERDQRQRFGREARLIRNQQHVSVSVGRNRVRRHVKIQSGSLSVAYTRWFGEYTRASR